MIAVHCLTSKWMLLHVSMRLRSLTSRLCLRACAASMSPARTIAPAVAFGMYQYMVAPLVGTLLGGLGAGMMYSYLYLFKPEDVPDAYVPLTCRTHLAHADRCVAND